MPACRLSPWPVCHPQGQAPALRNGHPRPRPSSRYVKTSCVLATAIMECGHPGPGIAPGSVVADPLALIDFTPTFLDIAGVPVPDTMDGISMLPALHASTQVGVCMGRAPGQAHRSRCLTCAEGPQAAANRLPGTLRNELSMLRNIRCVAQCTPYVAQCLPPLSFEPLHFRWSTMARASPAQSTTQWRSASMPTWHVRLWGRR